MNEESVEHHFFNHNNGKISYYVSQHSSQPLFNFIFLAGFGGEEAYFDFKSLAHGLSPSGNLFFIDPLGRGESDETSHSRDIQTILAELHALITNLSLTNIIFVAHSVGGIYAKEYSNTYQNVIGLILFEPITIESDNLFENDQNYINATKHLDTLSPVECEALLMDSQWTVADKKKIRSIKEQLIKRYHKGNSTFYHEGQKLTTNLNFVSQTKLNKKTNSLIICQPFRKDEYQRSIYFNTQSMIETLGNTHYLHRTNTEDSLQSILSFLNTISSNSFVS